MPQWLWDILISTAWYFMGRVDQHFGVMPPFKWYNHADVPNPADPPMATPAAPLKEVTYGDTPMDVNSPYPPTTTKG